MSDVTIDIPTDGTLLHALVDAGKLVRVENDLSDLLDEVTRAAWDRVTAEVTRAVQGLGGKELADGVSLYDIDVRIGQDWTRSVQRRGAGSLALTIVSGRNTILATSTTPTFLGKYADPRLSVDFGVLVTVVVSVPPVLAPLRVTAVEDLRIVLGRLDSQNVPGDIYLAVARFLASVAGISIEGEVQKALDGLDLAGRASEHLGPINERLAALSADGYSYQELLAGDAQSLARQLADAYGIPDAATQLRASGAPSDTQALLLVSRRPDRSGVIEGEIAWRTDTGSPLSRTMAAALDRIASSYLADDALRTVRSRVSAADADTSRWARLSLQPLKQIVTTTAPTAEPLAVTAAVVADTAARVPMATAATLTVQRPFTEASVWDATAPQPEPPPQAAPLRFSSADLVDALGGRVAYEGLMDLFRLGPVQFEVRCTNPSGQASGRTTMMWHDDDEGGWSSRRYRVEGVETEVPLTVSCSLAPDWVWRGGTLRSVEPVNWGGRVTVKPARDLDLAGALTSERLHARVVQADGSHRTVSLDALERAGVISGVREGDDRSIIVVGGRPGEHVSLNPQPLPPRARTLGKRLRGGIGSLGSLGALGDRVLRRADSVTEALRAGATTASGSSALERLTHRDDLGSIQISDIDVRDVTVPDVTDPTGHGTVRGIDFRVRADGTG